MAGFLSLAELKALPKAAVRQALVAGGAAGDHTVTGIGPEDQLRAVLSLDVTPAGDALQGADLAETQADHAEAARHTRTWAVADLTGEFSVTEEDTINNDGGTDTTGRALLVLWEDWTP